MASSRVLHPVLVALVLGSVVACGGSDGGPSLPDPSTSTTNAEDLDALVTAIGLEQEAMGTLLLVFSQNGTRPLFDLSIDWSDAKTVGEATDELHRVAAALSAHRPALEAALTSLAGKQAHASFAGSGAGDSERQRYALSVSDFFPSIFGWADEAKAKERENIVAVLEKGGPALQAQIHGLAQELRDEGRLGDLGADLGASPDEFLAKLKSGGLDALALHNLNKDAANENPDYDAAAAEVKGRPVDMLVKQGAEGLAAGGDTYWDLAKKTVAGGLGVAGAAFTKGTELVETAVGYVTAAEQAVTAPLDLLADEAIGEVQARFQAFIEDKTGLDGDTAEALVAGLSEDLSGLMANASASEQVTAGGAAPESLLAEGWGAVQLTNTTDVTGALVTWVDEATQSMKLLVSPGVPAEGASIVVPGGIEATVVGLGEGTAMTPPESAAVVQGQTVQVELPPLAGGEEPGDDLATGADADDWGGHDLGGADTATQTDTPESQVCPGTCDSKDDCFCGGTDALMCCCDGLRFYEVDCNGGCQWYGVCMFEGRVDVGDAYCMCLE